jgi:hypothetical protein
MFRGLVRDLRSSGLEETVFASLLPHYRLECVSQILEPLHCPDAFELLVGMAHDKKK